MAAPITAADLITRFKKRGAFDSLRKQLLANFQSSDDYNDLNSALTRIIDDQLRHDASLTDPSRRSYALQKLLSDIENSRTITSIKKNGSRTLLDRPEIKEKVEADIGQVLIAAQKERRAKLAEIKSKQTMQQNPENVDQNKTTTLTKNDDGEDFLSSILSRKRPQITVKADKDAKKLKIGSAIKIDVKLERSVAVLPGNNLKHEKATPNANMNVVAVEDKVEPKMEKNEPEPSAKAASATELESEKSAMDITNQSQSASALETKTKSEHQETELATPTESTPKPEPVRVDRPFKLEDDSSELSSLSSEDSSLSELSDAPSTSSEEEESEEEEPRFTVKTKMGVRVRGGVRKKPQSQVPRSRKGNRASTRGRR